MTMSSAPVAIVPSRECPSPPINTATNAAKTPASPYINHPIATELEAKFGRDVAEIVIEVTDHKNLKPAVCKQLQIDHATTLSDRAKLVKLADKICNLRDIIQTPPMDWDLKRRADYFAWAKRVIDPMRGISPALERLFDAEFARRPDANTNK